jgi:hypothetical protein
MATVLAGSEPESYARTPMWCLSLTPKTGLKKSRTNRTAQRTSSEYASDGPISPGRSLRRSTGMPWRFFLNQPNAEDRAVKRLQSAHRPAPWRPMHSTGGGQPVPAYATARPLLATAHHVPHSIQASFAGVAALDNKRSSLHAS